MRGIPTNRMWEHFASFGFFLGPIYLIGAALAVLGLIVAIVGKRRWWGISPWFGLSIPIPFLVWSLYAIMVPIRHFVPSKNGHW